MTSRRQHLDAIPRVLSIAGSDPSGGAGIQADLKTFGALGAYGMAAITALTAQNTMGVRAVHTVPADFLVAQVVAIFDDITVDAIKIGMLQSASTVSAVARIVRERRPPFVVLDPVMVSTSGDRLLDPVAISALRDELMPLADLVTPNTREAAALLDRPVATDEAGLLDHAQALLDLGAKRVLVKGGHLTGPISPDVLAILGQPPLVLRDERIVTPHTHGTGCTLSSAIAALRPQRTDWQTTVRDAKTYLLAALQGGGRLGVGHGNGPLDHFVDRG